MHKLYRSRLVPLGELQAIVCDCHVNFKEVVCIEVGGWRNHVLEIIVFVGCSQQLGLFSRRCGDYWRALSR